MSVFLGFRFRVATLVVLASLVGAGIYVGFFSRNVNAQIIETCRNATNKPLCYTDAINTVLREEGVPQAFDIVAFVYDSDPDFAATCHASTHDLGKVAYDEFKRTGNVVLSGKETYCGYGFYHGFIEALFVETNDPQDARDFCTYIGNNAPHPPPPEFAEGSCYHGIGHGVIDGTDPRIWGDPVAIVEPGLTLCKKLAPSDERWLSRCYSGVFNALGNMYPHEKYKLDSSGNPYTFCENGPFDTLEKEICYNQMNTEAARRADNRLEDILAFTHSATNERYRTTAVHEAVSFYIQQLRRQHKVLTPEEMNICAEEPAGVIRDGCVSGFVGGIFEFGSPGQHYKEVLSICGSPLLAQDVRSVCYATTLQNSSYYYAADVMRDVCDSVPTEYHDSNCRP